MSLKSSSFPLAIYVSFSNAKLLDISLIHCFTPGFSVSFYFKAITYLTCTRQTFTSFLFFELHLKLFGKMCNIQSLPSKGILHSIKSEDLKFLALPHTMIKCPLFFSTFDTIIWYIRVEMMEFHRCHVRSEQPLILY